MIIQNNATWATYTEQDALVLLADQPYGEKNVVIQCCDGVAGLRVRRIDGNTITTEVVYITSRHAGMKHLPDVGEPFIIDDRHLMADVHTHAPEYPKFTLKHLPAPWESKLGHGGRRAGSGQPASVKPLRMIIMDAHPQAQQQLAAITAHRRDLGDIKISQQTVLAELVAAEHKRLGLEEVE